MASTRDRARARALMTSTPGISYTEALRRVRATYPVPGRSRSTWLAGVYEANAAGGAWLSFEVLAHGTTMFGTREQACAELGVTFNGDTYDTNDPTLVTRARRGLAREHLLNAQHQPGHLRLYVYHAAHLDGARLFTFALPDDQRSVPAIVQALTPAANAVDARERLLGEVEAIRREPTRAPNEVFVADVFGIAPEPPDASADHATAVLNTLTDEFRGFWETYVANLPWPAAHRMLAISQAGSVRHCGFCPVFRL